MQFHIVIANKMNELSVDVITARSVNLLPHIYVNMTNGANLHIQCEKASTIKQTKKINMSIRWMLLSAVSDIYTIRLCFCDKMQIPGVPTCNG